MDGGMTNIDGLRRESVDEFTVDGGRAIALTMDREGFWMLEPTLCRDLADSRKRRNELGAHRFSLVVVEGANTEDVYEPSSWSKYIHQRGEKMACFVLPRHGVLQRDRLFCIATDIRDGGTEIWCTVARHHGDCRWLDGEEYCTNPYVHLDAVSTVGDDLLQVCRQYEPPKPN